MHFTAKPAKNAMVNSLREHLSPKTGKFVNKN
jgi:hypothetical protein